MTAKEELLEIVEGLPEEAAERLLPIAQSEAKACQPKGNGAELVKLLKQWAEEGKDVPDEDVKAYEDLMANREPVRFRLPHEW